MAATHPPWPAANRYRPRSLHAGPGALAGVSVEACGGVRQVCKGAAAWRSHLGTPSAAYAAHLRWACCCGRTCSPHQRPIRCTAMCGACGALRVCARRGEGWQHRPTHLSSNRSTAKSQEVHRRLEHSLRAQTKDPHAVLHVSGACGARGRAVGRVAHRCWPARAWVPPMYTVAHLRAAERPGSGQACALRRLGANSTFARPQVHASQPCPATARCRGALMLRWRHGQRPRPLTCPAVHPARKPAATPVSASKCTRLRACHDAPRCGAQWPLGRWAAWSRAIWFAWGVRRPHGWALHARLRAGRACQFALSDLHDARGPMAQHRPALALHCALHLLQQAVNVLHPGAGASDNPRQRERVSTAFLLAAAVGPCVPDFPSIDRARRTRDQKPDVHACARVYCRLPALRSRVAALHCRLAAMLNNLRHPARRQIHW